MTVPGGVQPCLCAAIYLSYFRFERNRRRCTSVHAQSNGLETPAAFYFELVSSRTTSCMRAR
jgi:hypothetical protein